MTANFVQRTYRFLIVLSFLSLLSFTPSRSSPWFKWDRQETRRVSAALLE